MMANLSLPSRLLLTVVALALLAYGLAVGGEFAFDDIHSVSANPALKDLGNLWAFWSDPGTFSGASSRMYRPALLTSFACNMALSEAAWSFKLFNVALHAATAGLLFWWLRALSRRTLAAAAVAMWFAVHPLLSEAVNLVSARSELLCVFGLLLGLHAHLRWQRSSAGGASAGRGSRSGASNSRFSIAALLTMAFATVLACGSKETGVMLPVLLVAQTFCLRHRWPNRSELRHAAIGIAPVALLVVVYLVLRKVLLGEVAVPLLDRPGNDPLAGYGRSLGVQLCTMGTLLPQLVWQAMVPWTLSLDPKVDYVAPPGNAIVWIGWASTATLTLAALLPGPSQRLRRLGCVIAWAVALPWVIIPLNAPFAEHRFYGVLLGFAVTLVPVWVWLRQRLPRIARTAIRLPRHLPRHGFVAMLTLFALLSASRSRLYRDERELWTAELAHNPGSFRAHWGLGLSRRRNGDLLGAVEPMRRAHALYPGNFDSLRHYVETLVQLPDEIALPGEAMAQARALLQRGPKDPWVRTLVAQTELQAARVLTAMVSTASIAETAREAAQAEVATHYQEAERLALSCLEIASPKGYVYRLAAFARHGLGDSEGALEHLSTSIERGLTAAEVHADRVRLLREMGRSNQAQMAMQRMQREHPTDPRTMMLLRPGPGTGVAPRGRAGAGTPAGPGR